MLLVGRVRVQRDGEIVHLGGEARFLGGVGVAQLAGRAGAEEIDAHQREGIGQGRALGESRLPRRSCSWTSGSCQGVEGERRGLRCGPGKKAFTRAR